MWRSLESQPKDGRAQYEMYKWQVGKFRNFTVATNGNLRSPSRKRIIKNRRRCRRKNKSMGVYFQKEYIANKRAVECEKHALMKKHAKQLRVLRKKFHRDMRALWASQAYEMAEVEHALNSGIGSVRSSFVHFARGFFFWAVFAVGQAL